MVVLVLRGYSLTLNSFQRHRSSANGTDDHFDDSRHGFESDYAANRNDDDVGFEIDVSESGTSLAIQC